MLFYQRKKLVRSLSYAANEGQLLHTGFKKKERKTKACNWNVFYLSVPV